MANLTFTSVDKIYEGNVQAVTNFDLDIKDKQFVVFVGPSGCGKSTSLRMVAGLEEITRGEIKIGERVINDIPPKDRDIAMVFQNYALYPHMTVRENMGFGLKLRGYPKADIEARVREASDILGLDELLDRTPAALSGGQRQRVAMGRAIVRKPKVFLFDEPLSNLDAKLRVRMRGEISKLHTRLQTTLIYVTHDQIEAMTMGDRIVVMRAGYIQQVDDPITLYHHPNNKFVAGFIGTPPMNFFDVELKKDGNYIYAVDGEMKIRLSNDIVEQLTAKNFNKTQAVLGIRPEDIYLKESYNNPFEDNFCKGNIDVVEPLGAQSFLYINNGNTTFIASGPNNLDQSNVGKNIEVAFDLKRVKLFDKDNEETVVDLHY